MRGVRKLLLVVGISMATITASYAQSQDMQFEVLSSNHKCASCTWIQASGEITNDTPARLRNFLSRYPSIQRVQIDSAGGSLLAALEIGEVLRTRNLQVRIGRGTPYVGASNEILAKEQSGECYSACVYAVIGGAIRTKVPGSTIGVHRFFAKSDLGVSDGLAQGQQISGLLIDYLTKMGVDPSLISIASTAGSDEVREIGDDQAFKLRLLTHAYDPGNIAPSRLPPQTASECDATRFRYPGSARSAAEAKAYNEFWKQSCNEYLEFVASQDGKHCQKMWDFYYEGLTKLPPFVDDFDFKMKTFRMNTNPFACLS